MDDTKTMTAEEVAQDVEVVSALIQNWHRTSPARIDCEASLSRIAAQAVRVPGLEAQVGDLADKAAATFTAATETRKRLEARAETAESERDAARNNAATANEHLQTVHAQVAEVAQLLDAEVVPDGWGLHAAAQRVIAERDTLRERVATLEADNRTLESQRDTMQVERNRALDYQKVLRARFDTAEARVRELEAIVKPLASVSCEEVASLDKSECGECPPCRARRAFSASQPRPAPAQGVKCKGCNGTGEDEDVDDDGKGHRFACTSCKGTGKTASPTPPPGLREVLAHVHDEREAWNVTANHPALVACENIERRLLAAYDATGGEHGPDSTCPNCKADHEDAAKYRAAVELAKDKEGMARALYAAVRGKTMRWENATGMVRSDAEVAAVAVAAHLLTLDTPQSGPGGGCKAHPGQQCDPETPGVYECRAVPASGRLLDAKPIQTSGPGGGEDWPLPPHEHCEMTCMVGRPQECAGPEMAGIRDGVRARIAPTPTPEGKTIQGVIEQGGTPPTGDASHPPQPTAPDVVWEGDGVRVLADGTPEMLVNTTWDVAHGLCVEAIARALAEAKREVRDSKVGHLVRAEVLAAERKKAAESMRERAVSALRSEIDHGEWSDTARDMLMNVVDAIRAPPLE